MPNGATAGGEECEDSVSAGAQVFTAQGSAAASDGNGRGHAAGDFNPIAFEESPVSIDFDEFYAGFDMRSGLKLTDKLLSLDGKEVVMEGYMAPPLSGTGGDVNHGWSVAAACSRSVAIL